MPVFDRIAAPYIDLFDSKTNVYYGKATFSVTPDVENALLQIVNGSGNPESIVLRDVTFFPASSEYVPPGIYVKYNRNGIIHADFRDEDSKLWIPADIYINFDSQARGNRLEDLYYFDSVGYSDVNVQEIRVFPQSKSS